MPSELLAPPRPSSRVRNPEKLKQRYSNQTLLIDECEFGLGVFARRAIRCSETILAFGGPVIDFAETKRRGEWECRAIQIGQNRYIDTLPPGVFVNHSCAPNAGVRNDRELVALRSIHPGEEICFDYSTTMEEQSFRMHCGCGTPECRHIIGDFSDLPPAVQQRYLSQGLVMRFIARRFRTSG